MPRLFMPTLTPIARRRGIPLSSKLGPTLWERLNYDPKPYIHIHPGCTQHGVRSSVRNALSWNDADDTFKPRWWYSQDKADYYHA